MKDVHKGLEGKRFKKPDGIVTAKICLQTGSLATSNCKSTYTEYFAAGTVPKECDGHTAVKVCKETGKLATEYCPEVEEKYYAARPEKEQNASWKPTKGTSKSEAPKDTCDKHTEETSKITIVNVVGKTESQAKSALVGLNIQVIYETHSDKENGVVLRQSLAEGTKVDKGVSIVITVNKRETTVEPPPEGENTQEPGENNNTVDPGNVVDPPENNTVDPIT